MLYFELVAYEQKKRVLLYQQTKLVSKELLANIFFSFIISWWKPQM